MIEFGAIPELADDEFIEIKERITNIEPDYKRLLKEISFITVEGLTHFPVLMATIGSRIDSILKGGWKKYKKPRSSADLLL